MMKKQILILLAFQVSLFGLIIVLFLGGPWLKQENQSKLTFGAGPQVATSPTTKPVKISVYYETLCPDSIRFIVEQVYPVYKSDLRNVTEFDLVPYGKATQKQIDGKWVFTCQHGPRECEGNIFQVHTVLFQNLVAYYAGGHQRLRGIKTCAIRLYTVDEYLPLIHCMEAKDEPEKAGKQCVDSLKKRGIELNYEKIESCTKSTQGNQWQHEMANRTHDLSPPLYFVPWINIDDVHNNATQRKALSNLRSVVCDQYKGTKPTSCGKSR